MGLVGIGKVFVSVDGGYLDLNADSTTVTAVPCVPVNEHIKDRYANLCRAVRGRTVSAGPIGELNLSLGGMFPQGNYARYADPGFTLDMRAIFHIPKVGFAAG